LIRLIEFHFDILSPFAHVAIARLSELLAAVKVRPIPVLLGAILSHWGQKGPAVIAPKRLQTYRIAAFLGEKHGAPLTFPPRHPFNPLSGLRLLAGANDCAGADPETVRRAFEFVFRDGRAPDTDSELLAFAEAIGASAALASEPAAKAKLSANQEDAIARGVFGVPTFCLPTAGGEDLFWGVDAFDMLKARLADEAMFDREPHATLSSIQIGILRSRTRAVAHTGFAE